MVGTNSGYKIQELAHCVETRNSSVSCLFQNYLTPYGKDTTITVVWLIAIWVFESFFPKNRYFFICRDLLATDEISDNEVSDDEVAEMRSRYFAQQQVIQRQHISVYVRSDQYKVINLVLQCYKKNAMLVCEYTKFGQSICGLIG